MGSSSPPPRLLGGLALCAALLPAIAAAQPAPVTPEIAVSSPSNYSQFLPSVAARPDGGFVAAWQDSTPLSRAIRAGIHTASGTAVAGNLRVSQTDLPLTLVRPSVAIHASGNFLVVWEGVGPAALGRVFDAAGAPKSGEIEIHRYAGGEQLLPSAAATPDGFVVTWSGPLEGNRKSVFARRYDAAGAPLGPELRVDSGTVEFLQHPAIAADAAGGFIVVWEGVNNSPAVQVIHVAGRLFDAAGTPRGGELQIDEPADFQSLNPSVAIAPDGSFFVAWERNRPRADVVGRLFGADGVPRGPALRLNGPIPGQDQTPQVAADPGGGFVAVWSFQGSASGVGGPRGRRVDAAGRPWGPELRFGHQPGPSFRNAVAFSSAGEFVAAWHGIVNGGSLSVIAQRFRFPEFAGADACGISGGLFVCDTLRAGETGLEIRFEARPGDVPLVGNLNGDLQDDPCFYRAGIFFCDLDHNGHPEAAVGFGGAPGDVPLLGDVNGDGRDDACVRRVRRFACDTAHNGGTAELQVVFGLKTDLPLLGDVDGDGDDDPCLFRAGRFLCDTAHDGGAAEVAVAFGLAGDTPLLGDMDGDGREDFCVFRGGRFLCDTAHDGGAAEVEILFGEPGTVPLLGNVDGY